MIPRLLHRIWLGAPMPAALQAYAETWREHHPTWRIIEWTETSIPRLQNQWLWDRAAEIAPNHVEQFRADVARYELLYQHGGVYIDCDFECLRPLDPLIEGIEAFAAWESDGIWINNAILGCYPKHPFLKRLIDGLPGNVARSRIRRPNVMSGPQYVTRLWREDPLGVAVFASKLFYPYRWDELHRRGEAFPDAYAVHHWMNQRRMRGQP